MDGTIRAAKSGDADAIAQLHVATWRSAYRGIVPDEHLDGLDWREWAAVRRERMASAGSNGVRTLVAVTDTSVIGFVSTGPERDGDLSTRGAQEVFALYVAPAAWGQGVGRDLLERAVDDVPPEIVFCLWVLADNRRARAFYERQGFRADGAATTIQLGGRDLAEVRYRLDRLDVSGRQVAKPSDR